MGPRILLHFSKETLENFPQILSRYVDLRNDPNSQTDESLPSNTSEVLEENQITVEEISSTHAVNV